MRKIVWVLLLFIIPGYGQGQEAQTFKVLFHNVHNYLSEGADSGKPKREQEKLALFEIWQQENPDILMLCEVGGPDQLLQIQEQMKKRGVDYPNVEWVEGSDESRHVALLTRFSIAERDPHEHLSYSVNGHQVRVQRGFLEADVQLNKNYRIKIFVAHLKSKLRSKKGAYAGYDQAEMRLNEARLLREEVEADLARNPETNLLVAGDMNDTPKSKPIKFILGSGLIDLCPMDSRGYNGTYFNRSKERYERIDYLFISPGLQKEYVGGTATLRDDKTAKIASDHFPVEAVFVADDE